MTRTGTAIVVLLAALGCSSVGSDPGGTCTYNGATHQAGTTFPATDGCNTCTCDAQGQVACSLLGCEVPVCSYAGTTHAVGASFPSADGCNSCSCTPSGAVACTERACFDGGSDSCTLDATYNFGWNGGLVTFVDRASLAPPSFYIYNRIPAGSSAPSVSCSPALPACSSDAIDVADIMADLADPDVQLAFLPAEPPIYGVDSRPWDGAVFEVWRSTGGDFLVGEDCSSPQASSTCSPIPAGVAKLVADLRALDDQQLADPTCAALQR
jgi:hypothetical protein